MKKYEKLCIKIKDLIRSIAKISDDYNEKYVEIKFDSDDELSLNKMVEIRAVFHENNKYYPQAF